MVSGPDFIYSIHLLVFTEIVADSYSNAFMDLFRNLELVIA